VNIRGESYRLKERRKAGLIPLPEQHQRMSLPLGSAPGPIVLMSSASYSLAGCTPAELASASPAGSIFNQPAKL
jgi:hypothetical protein